MIKNQKGFSVVEVLLVLLALGLIGGAGVYVLNHKNSSSKTNQTQQKPTAAQPSEVVWEQHADGWVARGTPPKCPEPLNLPSPADLTKVTSILYPGQYRSGEYKAHGGFRFDNNANNSVTITVPMDSVVVRGSHYEVKGEPQYTFDMIAPCGIMLRFGHLRILSPAFQKIADKFPNNGVGDSRSTNLNPVIPVKSGDVIATSTGLINDKNVFFDFGVYDLRVRNAISKDSTWTAKHPRPEIEWHAICWLDFMSAKDSKLVKSLPPGDPTSGKTSDYCR